MGYSDISACYKVSKTGFYCIISIAYGISLGLLGPSIPSLCDQMNLTYETFSLALSAGSLALILLSVPAGLLLNKLRGYHDLILSAMLLIFAVVVYFKVRSQQFWSFAVPFVVENLMTSNMDNVFDFGMTRLWGLKADAAIQAWHMSWSIGFAVAPLIMRSFLMIKDANITDYEFNNYNNISSEFMATFDDDLASYPDWINVTKIDTKSGSRFQLPHTIIAIILLVLAFINLPFCFYKPQRKQQFSLVETTDETTNNKFRHSGSSYISKSFIIQMCFCLTLYYFCVGGIGILFHTWVFTFAIKSDLGFSIQQAALIDSVNKFVLAGSRFFATPMSYVIPSHIMLFLFTFGSLIAAIPLALVGTSSQTNLWVLTCLFNVTTGPLWALGKGWIDKYIKLSPLVLSFIHVGANTSVMLFQWLSGYMLTHLHASSLMYLFLGIVSFLTIVVIIMQIRAFSFGQRYNRRQSSIELS